DNKISRRLLAAGALVLVLLAGAAFLWNRPGQMNSHIDQVTENEALNIFYSVTIERDSLRYPVEKVRGYYELGTSKITDITQTTAGTQYNSLDYLDRVTNARGCLGKELMPDEDAVREEIYEIKPTGGKQAAYVFITDGMALYNRCHLIGWFLGGENANWKNVMTGTRFFNTEGMLPVEIMVADYINKTGNHVIYQVTPLFYQRNLVAYGVVIRAFSVEDGGKGLDFTMFCPNVQPDVAIDYSDGSSKSMEDLLHGK
ncbi:MAG: DNA/RNA non-specific endonuclease, partial [Erysipelotrichaceae bacterium]|nr:DNA/RNA non-specific endonuclease [Erysipelotrichaceae bacterium]